ncbi:MAG: hypothetical protein HY964_01515 [Ignavibacteriales bacterium]|nr:hypothetical protein [Ignavibacteriales bacterium]
MKHVLFISFILIVAPMALSQTMYVHTKNGQTPFTISLIDSITFSIIPTLAHWPCDEGVGTILHDHSGNGFNSDSMSAGVSWVAGGINLNGGYNSVFFSDSIFRLSEGTWQVTINADSGKKGWILAKDNFGFNDDGMLTLEEDGYLYFTIHPKDSAYAKSAVANKLTPRGVDIVVTAQWGASGMKLFINNELVGSDPYTGPILSLGRPFCLGYGYTFGGASFDGVIKDVVIYNQSIK